MEVTDGVERTNRLITAETARELVKKTITQDHEVLRHITNEIYNAAISGYNNVRIGKDEILGVSLMAVVTHLQDLGFRVENWDKEIRIKWDAN
jgi:hypothetical protein